MKPFRKHAAIAIDGGGIKGLIVARALDILEDHLGKSLHDTFRGIPIIRGLNSNRIVFLKMSGGCFTRRPRDASSNFPGRQRRMG